MPSNLGKSQYQNSELNESDGSMWISGNGPVPKKIPRSKFRKKSNLYAEADNCQEEISKLNQLWDESMRPGGKSLMKPIVVTGPVQDNNSYGKVIEVP